MKRAVFFILIFIIICFSIPIIFTNRENTTTTLRIENEAIEKLQEYNYGSYSTMKLLHTETNEIEELSLDEYLYGVVAAEMPASYETEALKAQAIVARTYTIYSLENNTKHENANICDDSACCQAWISKDKRLEKWEEDKKQSNWTRITEAVDNTKGKIITYNGSPIKAFFHANSGGNTEKVINVWGENEYPYLQTVATAGESNYSQYSSEVIMTEAELLEKIRQHHQDIEINFEKENWFQIIEYTEGGRVKKIKFGNIEIPGTEARTIFGLKSANFSISIEGENIKFNVIGYGHGVGMSQTGANSMAKEEKSCEEIIKHYYLGVEIIDI